MFENPILINEIRDTYGAQAIVASIQAKKRDNENYECLTNSGREKTGKELFKWIEELNYRGVGEILVTSVDQDGTNKGFDKVMIDEIMHRFDLSIIAAGGAGRTNDVIELIKETKVEAVCLGSILHYSSENNIRRVHKEKPKNLEPVTIEELKEVMVKENINCRLIN